MSTFTGGQRFRTQVGIPNADLIAPVSGEQVSPDAGFCTELTVVVQVTIATGGTLTVLNAAGVAIPGLVVTVPNGAAKGTVFTAVATKGALARAVLRNDRLQVVPAGFAGAGAVKTDLTVYTLDNPQMPY